MVGGCMQEGMLLWVSRGFDEELRRPGGREPAVLPVVGSVLVTFEAVVLMAL